MTVSKPVFGITGASGSGKSYISGIFRSYGIDVIDADTIGHYVTSPEGAAYGELKQHFGTDIFDSSGNLVRSRLAEIVFSDKKELCILNEITHKHIKSEICSIIKNSPSPSVGIDGAVIIGSPVEAMCDFIIGVIAPFDVQIDRIMFRDGISAEKAKLRLQSQPSDEFYRSRCRYIIENSGKDVRKEAERIIFENKLLGETDF